MLSLFKPLSSMAMYISNLPADTSWRHPRPSNPFRLFCSVILATAIALTISGPASASGPGGGLAGEAFTDPSRRVEMPADWVAQPIRYEKWAEGADLAVSLDQHLYSAYEPLIREYARKNGLKIAVNEGTCGISAGMLSRKAVDIAGFCCPAGESDRLPGIKFHTIGIAALALIVHPANPVEGITSEQARRIYMGELYGWSEIRKSGWEGEPPPIRTVGRLHCKTRPGHWRLMLDSEDLFSIRLQEVGTIQDMISLVAGNPGAIGHEVVWMTRRFEDLGKVRPLRIDGAAPDDDKALVAREYPFYRTLVITTWDDKRLLKPEAAKLRDFMLESAASLDGKYGVVPHGALRRGGWKFLGDELVGVPAGKR